MSTPIAYLIDDTADSMDSIVKQMDLISADQCGLDIRAGRLYISREGIVVRNSNRRTLNYYGGFEYVDEDYVHTLGDYTFYNTDDERVLNAVAYYMSQVSMRQMLAEEEG